MDGCRSALRCNPIAGGCAAARRCRFGSSRQSHDPCGFDDELQQYRRLGERTRTRTASAHLEHAFFRFDRAGVTLHKLQGIEAMGDWSAVNKRYDEAYDLYTKCLRHFAEYNRPPAIVRLTAKIEALDSLQAK